MMRLTPLHVLCPDVREIERLVFEVASRRKGVKPWRVDLEWASGCGRCACPSFNMHKNRDCYHLQQVRKYIAIKVAQQVMRKNQVEEEPF